MHLFQAVRVTEKTPGATRTAFGVAIPTDEDFSFPGPAFGMFRHPEGLVEVRCQSRGTQGLAFASPRVIRAVLASFERHPLGVAEYDAEGRARRIDKLRELLPANGELAMGRP